MFLQTVESAERNQQLKPTRRLNAALSLCCAAEHTTWRDFADPPSDVNRALKLYFGLLGKVEREVRFGADWAMTQAHHSSLRQNGYGGGILISSCGDLNLPRNRLEIQICPELEQFRRWEFRNSHATLNCLEAVQNDSNSQKRCAARQRPCGQRS